VYGGYGSPLRRQCRGAAAAAKDGEKKEKERKKETYVLYYS